MKTPELKPCPFCGGVAAPLYKHMTANGYDGTVYRMRCAICHAQSPYKRNAWLHGWHENLADAADAWNRRAKDENV